MNEASIRKHVRKLMREALTEASSKEASNTSIGHMTEALAGLLAWNKITASDVKSTNKAGLVSAVVKNYGDATNLFAGAWDNLEAAGKLDEYLNRSRDMGATLTAWLQTQGKDPAAPVKVDRVIWTGPGGGVAKGVGTADIVVEGVGTNPDGSAKPYRQGYSAKASKSAGKTKGGLGADKVFAGTPLASLENLSAPEKITQTMKGISKSAAAEILGGAGSKWPESAKSGYAAAAWLKIDTDTPWPNAQNPQVTAAAAHAMGEEAFIKKANVSSPEREFGRDMWIKYVSRYRRPDLGEGLLSPTLVRWVAQQIAGRVDSGDIGRRILQNLYDHQKEGNVYTLYPSNVTLVDPTIVVIRDAVKAGAVPTVHLSKSSQSQVFLCFDGKVIAKFRPRVKEAGKNMLVNFTVVAVALDEACPTDSVEIFPEAVDTWEAAYGPDEIVDPATGVVGEDQTQWTMSDGKVYLQNVIREALIRELLITEKLNKSDKAEIQKLAKKQAKKYFDAEIDKALGVDWFFGNKGKVNKFVSDEIDKRFKDAAKDKAFADAVEIVTKRCLQALFNTVSKRPSFIKTMSVPKS